MILILGGSGCIGSNICAELGRRSLEFKNLSRAKLDYTNAKTLEQAIREFKPAFLINCAGLTGKPNVDACEQMKSECLAANAVLPGTIRQVCESVGLPWGHISSGCIYTGRPSFGNGFQESDPPNFSFRRPPCSWYSGCKALGEECLDGASNIYIWRLRIPFWSSESPKNYLSKIMQYPRLLDVENSITHVGEFASACVQSWIHRIPFGTYNVTNGGSITTRRITELVNKFIDPNKLFSFFRDEEEFLKLVATPRSSCVLDNQKLVESGVQMSSVEDAVVSCLKNWNRLSQK